MLSFFERLTEKFAAAVERGMERGAERFLAKMSGDVVEEPKLLGNGRQTRGRKRQAARK